MAMTAAQAKEWYKKSGVRFGNNVVFKGYPDQPLSNKALTAIVILAGSLFTISLAGLGLLGCAHIKRNCMRRRYSALPNPQNNEQPTNPFQDAHFEN